MPRCDVIEGHYYSRTVGVVNSLEARSVTCDNAQLPMLSEPCSCFPVAASVYILCSLQTVRSIAQSMSVLFISINTFVTGCPTGGPRAASGPRPLLIRPSRPHSLDHDCTDDCTQVNSCASSSSSRSAPFLEEEEEEDCTII